MKFSKIFGAAAVCHLPVSAIWKLNDTNAGTFRQRSRYVVKILLSGMAVHFCSDMIRIHRILAIYI
jgi:hypothetical protein